MKMKIHDSGYKLSSDLIGVVFWLFVFTLFTFPLWGPVVLGVLGFFAGLLFVL
jgi:F0F1-type ATP synthase assembly protein I